MLEEVWGLHEDTDTRAIDNFIVRLRRYIEDDPTNPRHLLTVRGVGYRFVADAGGRGMMRRHSGRARRPGVAAWLAVCAAPAATSTSCCWATAPGKSQAGIYERVWQELAASQARASCCPWATRIQGCNDATAEAEWREVRRILEPYRRIPLYLAPGNHDIWSEASEHCSAATPSIRRITASIPAARISPCWTTAGRTPGRRVNWHGSKTICAAHRREPVKFVVSHRPSWLLDAALGNTTGPLHAMAKRYGVCCIIAGHVHQLIHAELDGVTYLALPSAGGHLRLSGKYEDGWFFGWTGVEVRGKEVQFQVHALDRATTPLSAWGRAGLLVHAKCVGLLGVLAPWREIQSEMMHATVEQRRQ